MSIDKALIVDDDALMRTFLAETLQRRNIEVCLAESGKEALGLLSTQHFDLMITDMKMPGISGIDLLVKVKKIAPSILVVVVTGFGTVESAVEAMRLGAFNYLIKPFTPETIETMIDKAKERASLLAENHYLRHQLKQGQPSSNIVIGQSPAIKKIIKSLPQIAKSSANVFIHGESGTGKEVIAQAIHNQSLRANNTFIKVNCAAIPDTLVESEFFGHEKGAFTGALAKKLGRFELANHGTLLLDEITEVPILLQAKLLRAIQERKFERVGGTREVEVDIRLISTSNRNMEEAIKQKILREDLYYRLNVVPIYLPPLRERKEDILPLAEYFLEKACRENHQELKTLTTASREKLLNYAWPGNARELANIIERAVVLNTNETIAPEHLYLSHDSSLWQHAQEAQMVVEADKEPGKLAVPIGTTLKDLEKKLIIETLLSLQNNHSKAAQLLGISPRTLRSKLQQYAIKRSDENSSKN